MLSCNDSLEIRSGRILQKLDEARRRRLLDKRQLRGGKLDLGPVLPEEKLARFERKHGITIPEAFRHFITHVGDGGTGPTYGLRAFDEWSEMADRGDELYGSGQLSLECPMWPGMPECVEAAGFHPDFSWTHLLRGTLDIATEGCSLIVVLIISGPFRGRVVHVDRERDGAPAFTQDEDFLAWYERWLDGLLRGWNVSWFGPGLAGDEETLAAVPRRPPHPTDQRWDALRTILRIPRIQPATARAIIDCMEDRRPQVRALAVQLAGKHKIPESIPSMIRAMKDSEVEVRVEAIRGLSMLRPAGWEQLVRETLGDVSYDVIFTSLCALRDAKSIRRENLMPLVHSDCPENRASAIYWWGKCGFRISTAPWFLDRIEDNNRRVLSQLICSARDIGDRGILPHLDKIDERMPGQLKGEIESTRRSASPIHMLTASWQLVKDLCSCIGFLVRLFWLALKKWWQRRKKRRPF